jgi:hypothetical protein
MDGAGAPGPRPGFIQTVHISIYDCILLYMIVYYAYSYTDRFRLLGKVLPGRRPRPVDYKHRIYIYISISIYIYIYIYIYMDLMHAVDGAAGEPKPGHEEEDVDALAPRAEGGVHQLRHILYNMSYNVILVSYDI